MIYTDLLEVCIKIPSEDAVGKSMCMLSILRTHIQAEEIKRGGAVDLRRKMTVGECERWATFKKA